MKTINRNIMINKAGGNASKGGMTYRISLPADSVRGIGVTPEDRSVVVEYDDEKIVIKKAK